MNARLVTKPAKKFLIVIVSTWRSCIPRTTVIAASVRMGTKELARAAFIKVSERVLNKHTAN